MGVKGCAIRKGHNHSKFRDGYDNINWNSNIIKKDNGKDNKTTCNRKKSR